MAKDRPRVGFIGAGRVARALAAALEAAGYRVVAVASKSPVSAERMASALREARATAPRHVVDQSDLVFITTPDDAIGPVASALRWRAGVAAVHCSGALTLAPLAAAAAQGADVGSLHPVQTFARDATFLNGVTFGVEGDGALRDALHAMARDVGGSPIEVPPEGRALYHAAAVLSCGYVATLLADAAALWQAAGLDPKAGTSALCLLARQTVDNARALGPEAALTGPAARGDAGTIELHLRALGDASPDLLSLYRAVGARSVALARRGAGDAETHGGWDAAARLLTASNPSASEIDRGGRTWYVSGR
ncbi:MAG: DUF2520 domain-containing protein [SAR202 cluster bacterium]|nr:DUF2520 domain-containing protein [SAR202 cluster bacterium]